MIVAIISPTILSSLSQSIKRFYATINQQQFMVERLEIHQRLFADMQLVVDVLTPCCFQQQYHVICYDIKDNRLRRRKKSNVAKRFYTHYIGKKKQFGTMRCKVVHPLVIIDIQGIDKQHVWSFKITDT